ncbi:uncharacterized protein I206_105293 [Kwoniella pini CBS 10737]|uniref:DNA replication complex GINS protein PSF1 n=1 Tax=Kwoniella pini CBS 10737 TaxID=1296096 RepID=A0A1B9I4P2_9TREE|nr:DNA replication complex GINS protein PSF1 [Kwoniella pini CBS 10737]OCF50474.1 DNA replication complex GINS protein PSF1 [Kwoniella pini CBS 10737]
MYGDLALQLVTASHRSTLSTTPQLPLPKYALPLILSICLETRQLGQSITTAAEQYGQISLSQDKSLVCNLTVQHLSARRNKRCLLTYLSTRINGIKERWWDSGGSLAYLLSNEILGDNNNNNNELENDFEKEISNDKDLKNNLSPQEIDFLKGYNNLMLDYKSDFLDILDLNSNLNKPPKELMIDIRVIKDAGEIFLENGEKVDFRKGERFRLNRSNIERLIVQGFLEEV